MANKNPVGKARDNPNHSPTLPEPEGRIKLTINPFEMYRQMIGPEVRRKICIFILCILCFALTLAVAPTFIGSYLSQLFHDLMNSIFHPNDKI